MSNANFKILDAGLIAGGLHKAKRVSPGKYLACCPAHDDKTPSLSVQDTSGKVLVYCHAGCTQKEVIGALRDMGLWHKSSQKHIECSKRQILKEEIRRAEMLLALAASENEQGIAHSKSDRGQIKSAIRFIERHGDV